MHRFFWLLSLVLLLSVVAACKKDARPPVPPAEEPAADTERAPSEPPEPEPPVVVEEVEAGEEPERRVETVPTLLDEAEALFEAGELQEADWTYQKALVAEPTHPFRGYIFYRRALIHADPGSDLFDLSRARELLDRAMEAGVSSHTTEVSILDTLLQQLASSRQTSDRLEERLEEIAVELERLKAVDRRRRIRPD